MAPPVLIPKTNAGVGVGVSVGVGVGITAIPKFWVVFAANATLTGFVVVASYPVGRANASWYVPGVRF